MVAVRSLALLLALLSPLAGAHTYSEHGNITVMSPVEDDVHVTSVLRSVAPASLPNGFAHYAIPDVRAGDAFTIVADDGQDPWCLGLTPSDCCDSREHLPPDGYDNGTPLEGTDLDRRADQVAWWAEDPQHVGFCNPHPDFAIAFSDGTYVNGPGDEQGMVPAGGPAFVILVFGDFGEGFTYSES